MCKMYVINRLLLTSGTFITEMRPIPQKKVTSFQVGTYIYGKHSSDKEETLNKDSRSFENEIIFSVSPSVLFKTGKLVVVKMSLLHYVLGFFHLTLKNTR